MSEKTSVGGSGWVRGIALAVFALVAASLPGELNGQSLGGRIDELVRTYHEQARFNGAILVAHKNRVVYRKAFGWANAEWGRQHTPTTRFRIGSITKQFTAMLILQLMEEGKLRLDGTIRDYLPEYPAPQGDRVTIHQLLTHTSGIPSYTNRPTYPAMSRNPVRPMDLIGTFDSLPFEFEPGTQFRYNNSGYFILGAIIERLTGMPYDQTLKARILTPLGLTQTGYDWNADIVPERAAAYRQTLGGLLHADYLDMSVPYAAGSMYSTVDDLWRWSQALTQRKLLSAEGYGLFERAHAAGGHYGYGWGFDGVSRGAGRDSATAISHGGGINGFRSMIYRIPGDGITIVWLDNSEQSPPLHEEIRKLIYGEEVALPKPSIGRALLSIIKAEGVEAGVRRYREARAGRSGEFDFGEPELNTLGYALLRGGRVQDAIRIFALNVEMYPDGFNTYDSLGEGYLVAGDTALAALNYRRSLELNAGNANARTILGRLSAR